MFGDYFHQRINTVPSSNEGTCQPVWLADVDDDDDDDSTEEYRPLTTQIIEGSNNFWFWSFNRICLNKDMNVKVFRH